MMLGSFASIDHILEDFCKSKNLQYGKSMGDWLVGEEFDGRIIRWKNNENTIDYVIQIYSEIERENVKNWIFWVCASQDRGHKRFSKSMTLYSGTKVYIIGNFASLLNEGYASLLAIKENDLEFATYLSTN